MLHIAAMNLAAVDLNLLNAFDALLIERNVSRAAVRVGITQPGMSNVLSRLRTLFGDELFVRTPQEMRPTPRALDLAEPISQALELLRTALNRTPRFDAASSTRLFTVGASDNCDFGIAPAIAKIRQLAPNIAFEIVAAKRASALEKVQDGSFDLAVGRLGKLPERCFSMPLYEERFVFMINGHLRAADTSLTIEKFCALPHIRVWHDSTEFVDAELGSRGMERQIAMVLPNFALLPYAVEQSDLVAVVGERIARRFAALPWIRIHELPLSQQPWTISAVWGVVQNPDPGAAWLRAQLQRACEGL